MKTKFNVLIGTFLVLFITACNCGNTNETKNSSQTQKVAWAKNTNIYEVNIRQYTPEGTFKAFEAHLPRLKNMGVDMLWIMPIHPVGEEKRKGTLGSYYAVKDYQKVNPEFGTLEDFKQLVKATHEHGMKLIIDWVPNHSAWDNWLVTEHPDWYTKDSLGNMMAPVEDWSDVVDLNYDNHELRTYMIESLEYWITEADIDGYRCDVAGMVPLDFWTDARKALDEIKPIFFLAEVEQAEIHAAFDMTYGWEFHHIMNKIAQGEMNTQNIISYFEKIDTSYQADDYIMNFTSNHDENSWNGTVKERMGDAYKTMAVLSFTAPGMPLIYSGQEAGLDKRLEFFEKDSISWENLALESFYKTLLTAKTNNQALWNGTAGGNINFVKSMLKDNVLTFTRKKDGNEVLVILNFSEENQVLKVDESIKANSYSNIFNQETLVLNEQNELNLEPYGYMVLVQE